MICFYDLTETDMCKRGRTGAIVLARCNIGKEWKWRRWWIQADDYVKVCVLKNLLVVFPAEWERVLRNYKIFHNTV